MESPCANFFLETLESLQQISTVDEFYLRLDNLRNLILESYPWIWERYFLSRFIVGLKHEVQIYVLQHHPITLLDAYELASIKEYSLRSVDHTCNLHNFVLVCSNLDKEGTIQHAAIPMDTDKEIFIDAVSDIVDDLPSAAAVVVQTPIANAIDEESISRTILLATVPLGVPFVCNLTRTLLPHNQFSTAVSITRISESLAAVQEAGSVVSVDKQHCHSSEVAQQTFLELENTWLGTLSQHFMVVQPACVIVHCQVMFSCFRILEHDRIRDKGGTILSSLKLVPSKDQPRPFCVPNGGTNLNIDVGQLILHYFMALLERMHVLIIDPHAVLHIHMVNGLNTPAKEASQAIMVLECFSSRNSVCTLVSSRHVGAANGESPHNIYYRGMGSSGWPLPARVAFHGVIMHLEYFYLPLHSSEVALCMMYVRTHTLIIVGGLVGTEAFCVVLQALAVENIVRTNPQVVLRIVPMLMLPSIQDSSYFIALDGSGTAIVSFKLHDHSHHNFFHATGECLRFFSFSEVLSKYFMASVMCIMSFDPGIRPVILIKPLHGYILTGEYAQSIYNQFLDYQCAMPFIVVAKHKAIYAVWVHNQFIRYSAMSVGSCFLGSSGRPPPSYYTALELDQLDAFRHSVWIYFCLAVKVHVKLRPNHLGYSCWLSYNIHGIAMEFAILPCWQFQLYVQNALKQFPAFIGDWFLRPPGAAEGRVLQVSVYKQKDVQDINFPAVHVFPIDSQGLLVGKVTEGASQLVQFQSIQSLPHLTFWLCCSRPTGVLCHSVFHRSVSFTFFGLCAYWLFKQSDIMHTIHMACKTTYSYILAVCSIKGLLLPYSMLVWASRTLMLIARWYILAQLLYFSVVFVGALIPLSFSLVQLVPSIAFSRHFTLLPLSSAMYFGGIVSAVFSVSAMHLESIRSVLTTAVLCVNIVKATNEFLLSIWTMAIIFSRHLHVLQSLQFSLLLQASTALVLKLGHTSYLITITAHVPCYLNIYNVSPSILHSSSSSTIKDVSSLMQPQHKHICVIASTFHIHSGLFMTLPAFWDNCLSLQSASSAPNLGWWLEKYPVRGHHHFQTTSTSDAYLVVWGVVPELVPPTVCIRMHCPCYTYTDVISKGKLAHPVLRGAVCPTLIYIIGKAVASVQLQNGGLFLQSFVKGLVTARYVCPFCALPALLRMLFVLLWSFRYFMLLLYGSLTHQTVATLKINATWFSSICATNTASMCGNHTAKTTIVTV